MTCDYNISGLFPTPLYKTKINFDPTEEQKEFIDFEKTKLKTNFYNKCSINTNILHNNKMVSIKEKIEKHIQNYLIEIHSPSSPFSLRITQSWINVSNKEEGHHKHFHQNSFISGVYYLNAKPEMGGIIFHKNYISPYKIESYFYKEFNAENWQIPVETGTLILFPSFLEHSVSQNTLNEERMSLSFNTFFVGEMGSKETLTELIL